MTTTTPPSGMARAVAAAGSQLLLAKQLGVTQQFISLCLRRGWVPLRRAQEIEALYGIPRAQTMNPRVLDLVDAAKGEGL